MKSLIAVLLLIVLVVVGIEASTRFRSGKTIFDWQSLSPYMTYALDAPEWATCTIRGKSWRYIETPYSLEGQCITEVKEWGEACQSGSDCHSGVCFIDTKAVADTEGNYTGRCAYPGERNICTYAEITNGQITQDKRGSVCE